MKREINSSSSYKDIGLWKVNIAFNEKDKLKHITTEDDIGKKLGGELLIPIFSVKKLFLGQLHDDNIHIIVQLPVAVAGSVKASLPLLIHIDELVSSFGANFPLQGRGETLKMLLHGTKDRNGVCQRLKYLRENNIARKYHSIPTIANGPGTGKNRFLQNLPVLLLNQDADELKNLRSVSVNITFNGKSTSLEDEISAGPASDFFQILCLDNWDSFTINRALKVVIRDIGENIDLIVFGIDELNLLHSLAISKTTANPVQEIVRAVEGLSTSGRLGYQKEI
ncbi:hypothetical protein C1646_751423 [Rhizophagus diaphanus]|nr:hypothetical protein C1646_751423 [Rhizophagus diaphanus] [Rhizophagus sp. MUCL 43196]